MSSGLAGGTTFADLSAWWKVLVRGGEALSWLNDLLTADLAGLEHGRTQRTLLLTPTGRIRADVAATPLDDGILLVQDPAQPTPIARLLAPYVLSSDVELQDRSEAIGLAAFVEAEPAAIEGARTITPSVLGWGSDLIGPPDLANAVRHLGPWTAAEPEDVDRWRIARGVARFPVDLTTDSLPHETPLGDAVAFDKGCYLGQEAVAKVRNLGRPPFVVLAATAASTAPGDEVLADGSSVGTITSAAPLGDGRTAAILRVRWAARESALTLADGSPLEVRGSAAG